MTDKLQQIRMQIDAMDQQILEALHQRTALIEQVAQYKQDDPVKIRPAREIQMNAMLKKQHIAAYPAPVLQHIWRQIIGSTLLCEGDFPVGLLDGQNAVENLQLRYQAKSHFGILCPLMPSTDLAEFFQNLLDFKIQVGIISAYAHDAQNAPWWFLLAQIPARESWNLRICLKLPLWEEIDMPSLPSYALSCAHLQQSGSEQSYFVLRVKAEYYAQAVEIITQDEETMLLDTYAKEHSIFICQNHNATDYQSPFASDLLETANFVGYAQAE